MAKTNVNMDEQNDEADSELADYQDLVDLVEEDAENRGDPDIKAEQKKVQQKKRMSKPKAKAKAANPDDLLLGPPKKGKGRGKGRGRGRGKGKGRGRFGRRNALPLPDQPAETAEPPAELSIAEAAEPPPELSIAEAAEPPPRPQHCRSS